MKRKIVVVICIILLICISTISNFLFSTQENIIRYEQHLQAPKTQDSGSVENGDLVSHLPLISISTNGQKIPGMPIYSDEKGEVIDYEKGDNGEEEIKVEINIYDNSEAQNSIKN